MLQPKASSSEKKCRQRESQGKDRIAEQHERKEARAADADQRAQHAHRQLAGDEFA